MTTPTPDTVQLLPCPCGETPTTLLITAEHDTPKWAYCCGDCCNVWSIEYRNAYVSITSNEGIARAREAWNEATRAPALATGRTAVAPVLSEAECIREFEAWYAQNDYLFHTDSKDNYADVWLASRRAAGLVTDKKEGRT